MCLSSWPCVGQVGIGNGWMDQGFAGSITIVWCLHKADDVFQVVVSLVNSRPGAKNFTYSPVLRDFTKATNIRLRFLRTNTLLGHLISKAQRDPTVTRRVSRQCESPCRHPRCFTMLWVHPWSLERGLPCQVTVLEDVGVFDFVEGDAWSFCFHRAVMYLQKAGRRFLTLTPLDRALHDICIHRECPNFSEAWRNRSELKWGL